MGHCYEYFAISLGVRVGLHSYRADKEGRKLLFTTACKLFRRRPCRCLEKGAAEEHALRKHVNSRAM